MLAVHRSGQQSKNEMKYLPLILQHILTSQNPNWQQQQQSQQQQEGSRVRFQENLESETAGRSCARCCLASLVESKQMEMIGQRGTKTTGANPSRSSHTINLCKKCFDERRLKKGEAKVAASKWRTVIEQKAFRRKLWAAFRTEHFLRRM